MTQVLTKGAQEDYYDFLTSYSDRGCSCHINPPCGFCTHPGNPSNLTEDDNNFTEIEEAKREDNKYLVFKNDDLKFIPFSLLPYFIRGVEAMQEGRAKAGKSRTNNYVVCNLDEPYAEKIWQVILEGENEKLKSQHTLKEDLA